MTLQIELQNEKGESWRLEFPDIPEADVKTLAADKFIEWHLAGPIASMLRQAAHDLARAGQREGSERAR